MIMINLAQGGHLAMFDVNTSYVIIVLKERISNRACHKYRTAFSKSLHNTHYCRVSVQSENLTPRYTSGLSTAVSLEHSSLPGPCYHDCFNAEGL